MDEKEISQKKVTKSKKKKQFDLSDKRVAPELQGAVLASFKTRSLAFAADWLIIALASQFFILWIILLLIYLLSQKKLKSTISKGNVFLLQKVDTLDKKLESFEIESTIRKNFIKYIKTYIYGMMIFVIVLSLLFTISLLIGIFLPDDFLKNAVWLEELGMVLSPAEGIEKIFNFFVGAFGGFVYFTFFTWKWNGQTPAKRFFKIKTAKLNGKNITFWNSLERASGYVASASLFFMGFLQYFWDKNHQTTHDRVTETIVIQD